MKVRNVHNASVRGIPARGFGEASEDEIARYPWALVPVGAPLEQEPEETPEPPKRGPGRPRANPVD